MTRMIYVPGGEKWIPVSLYVQGIKAAKANPDGMFKHGLTTWWAVTGAEIMDQFRAGMMDRIGQAIPYSKRGLTP